MNTPDVYRDAEYIADVSGIPNGGAGSLAPVHSSSSGHAERLKKVQTAAKVAFIDRLLRDLDILIYCELSALYYMDCSIILFAIRAIVQLIFFTPKAPPFDPTRNQPFVAAILGSNLLCMIFHKFFTRAEAGEATRGYLHGGLLIDFIGQKAPVSLARLLSLDLLILVLDLIMLGLVVERVKTVEPATARVAALEPVETSPSADGDGDGQDHDLEERGMRHARSASAQATENGIELGELDSRGMETEMETETDVELEERTQLLADPTEGAPARDTHPMDPFVSGQTVIMDVGLLNVIRDQWRYSPTAVRRSSPYVPSDQTAAFLRERFGIRVGADGRMERIAPE
ncbi:DUF1746-domain-containing protein [Aspergillus heteromorphus CBS 117.55]|uniref:DUF1746-domain-containing protein n=1 Tax=Aspergillus heteromorphus CBS 117.55 TaxID=1448321 RepID=A0A317X551_9EURO|nr:DUF1746-domain-containing protein [Aspergillus heteromorphus CBS 117.55]PWY92742.1 DUF1746-domain-containing protein [Aspergillus heteromorphus CBS 117.55]